MSNSLDPDQDRHSVAPDLVPNCLQRLPGWHLCITQMEKKRTEWYAMTSHVIAYRSKELLFGMHAFNFNCLLDDFNCVFTQIHCISVLLNFGCIYR